MDSSEEMQPSSLKRLGSSILEPNESSATKPAVVNDPKRIKTNHGAVGSAGSASGGRADPERSSAPQLERSSTTNGNDEGQDSRSISEKLNAVASPDKMELAASAPSLSAEHDTARGNGFEFPSSDEQPFPKLESTFNQHRPRLAAYHPYIQYIEIETSKACHKFLELQRRHKSAGYSNEALDLVCQKILEFCSPTKKYPLQKPVAFIGPMGVGKSQLICALLNKTGIATTSDTDRGTNIVHEFAGAKVDQGAMFVVDCFYYPTDEIRQRTRKLCKPAFDYFELSRQKETEPDEVDTDDLAELHVRLKTAANVFYTLLCDHEKENFATEYAVQEWLEEQFESVVLEAAVDQLMDYITAFMQARGVESGMESHEASSIDELHEVYASVSKPPKTRDVPPKSHPWPLVRKLRVHFDHDVLNQGITLADTPGLSDSNKAIVDATKSYIYSAGFLFVLAPFLRCQDSAELSRHLKLVDYAGRMNSSRLVLTKFDGSEMSIDKAALPATTQHAIEATEQVIEQLERRKHELVLEKGRLRASQQWQEYHNADVALERLPSRLDEERAKLYQHKVLGRNAVVAHEMRDKYRAITRLKHAPDLQTHFTAATEYEKHQQAKPKNDKPRLDIQATGIPAIHEVLYRIPAAPKYDILQTICRRTLPRLFENVISIMRKTSFERHHEVRSAIKHILESQCQSVLDNIAEKLETSYQRNLAARFETHQMTTWPERAKRLPNQWEKVAASTLKAFCRRKGKWKMAKGHPITSWNEQIRNVLSEQIQEGFEGFDSDIKTMKINAASDVSDRIFAPLSQALNDYAFHEVSDSESFINKIDEEKQEFLIFLNESCERFRRGIDHVRCETVTSDGSSSYVAQAMSETYSSAAEICAKDYPKAKRIKGKREPSGAHTERMRQIRLKVTEKGPSNVFCEVNTQVEHACTEVGANLWLRIVGNKLVNIRTLIMKEFDMRYQVPCQDQACNEQVESELEEGARTVMQYLRSRAAKMLEVAEEWEGQRAS